MCIHYNFDFVYNVSIIQFNHFMILSSQTTRCQAWASRKASHQTKGVYNHHHPSLFSAYQDIKVINLSKEVKA